MREFREVVRVCTYQFDNQLTAKLVRDQPCYTAIPDYMMGENVCNMTAKINALVEHTLNNL